LGFLPYVDNKNKHNSFCGGLLGFFTIITKITGSWNLWFTAVLIVVPEAEVRRIRVGSQPGQIVQETLS
jgi:hypothetical protein